MSERDKIVAWLRREGLRLDRVVVLGDAADAIERGEHLKRPEPTIPYEDWRDKPSVGH